ncbi:cystatin domain protein (macronuclear) [Tetrahymena thermophila SB210]|uniref:Cystatin domain protein n=1 Tax=Tetrahymena thermophila (strain SB210) TaxID=312017 RepID=W7XEU3_TETTS|nr:cystatin domain protein [Tetrahymena thermophila SB210]EWS72466.1 cystatin domain protein [Tetrahymena thermophila SB210]|eukprot:XP_012655011.1 cystatin domain protein [Tetrahymena thermophila SB210]
MLCGGFQGKEITQKQHDLANHHLQDVNNLLGKSFTSLNVTKYSSQIVAGTNHLLEAEANDGTKLSLKVFEPLPHTNSPTQLSEAKLL